jgi:hypothetical protein
MKGNDDELASFSIDVADAEDAQSYLSYSVLPGLGAMLAAEPSTASV